MAIPVCASFRLGSVSFKDINPKPTDFVSIVGWDGDKNAAFFYADGSYYVPTNDTTIDFGFSNKGKSVNWSLKDGYLPCHRVAYTVRNVNYVLNTFADCVEVNGTPFVVAYTKVAITNNSYKKIKYPKASKQLTALSDVPKYVEKGETTVVTYAYAIDSFGLNVAFPYGEALKEAGDFESHLNHMSDYWNTRLTALATLSLPDKALENSYKATFIQTMIIKDGEGLHVGEGKYDRVFDHDCIGILVALLAMGETDNFAAYASHILDNVQYDDARWKYSYPYAVYYQKTGDLATITAEFASIKSNTHYIEAQRNEDGIMHKTEAIDAGGFWLVDDWSALTGLTTYAYLCSELHTATGDAEYLNEYNWAIAQYNSLLQSVEAVLDGTVKKYNLDYLPVSLYQPNSENRCKNSNDANWAATFLFGRWAWDGYLFGANQDGSKMIEMLDATYAYGLGRLKAEGFDDYTFGGFPGVCSAYNAGYGSAALRGDQYRDIGIKAYKYMLNNTQTSPNGWWECAVTKTKKSFVNGCNVVNGWGSCPHAWGQTFATKILLDSIISEKSDGSVIIGRGIPNEWLADGKKIEVSNYKTSGGIMSFSISAENGVITIDLSQGHAPATLELPLFLQGDYNVQGSDKTTQNGVLQIEQGVTQLSLVKAQ